MDYILSRRQRWSSDRSCRMAKFSRVSRQNLDTSHGDLHRLLSVAIRHFDFSVICGFRGEAAQHEAFLAGRSKVDWPDSKHNRLPSHAVDIVPWPVDWSNTKKMIYLAGFVMGIAKMLDVRIRWGGDWNMDYDPANEQFMDIWHFELLDG